MSGAPKVGRNDPCPCGSGKKYKKCHLGAGPAQGSDTTIDDRFAEVLAAQHRRAELETSGYFLPHIQTIHQGKRFRAVGNRLYPALPLSQTFHEFVIGLLGAEVGKQWLQDQRALPEAEQHFIVKCYSAYTAWRRKHQVTANRVGDHFGAIPDGWTRSLIALAFDVYCLLHRASLPHRLIERLKDPTQYQGARYEIAVAAIFTRLGFSIEFLDRRKPGKKRCEFIATHEEKNVSIAVEVKSRHRPGVLGFPGASDEMQLLKGDVRTLLAAAVDKAPGDRPFMVFIDLNSPLTPEVPANAKPWFGDLLRSADHVIGANDPKKPDPFNIIFVTNFSFHYQSDREADPGEYVFVVPRYVANPLPDQHLLGLIERGVQNYGAVPHLE